MVARLDRHTRAVRALEFSVLEPHMLASGADDGEILVWDLKKPDQPSAYPPLKLWDLRNTISPVQEFVGHTKGVVDMSWCPYDSSFLLSSSKGNRTICWDTVSGEIITEIPTNSNGHFDLHWYRRILGVVAASSFDGKVGIYNLEFSSRYAEGDGVVSGQGHARAPAPKLLKCPTGASFGFGGKLVSFHPATPRDSEADCSEVYLHNLVLEQNLVTRSIEFESAVRNGEKSSLRALCDKKSQESLSEEERETWRFLKVMLVDKGISKTNIIAHLGFNVPQGMTENSTDELNKTMPDTVNLDSDIF